MIEINEAGARSRCPLWVKPSLTPDLDMKDQQGSAACPEAAQYSSEDPATWSPVNLRHLLICHVRISLGGACGDTRPKTSRPHNQSLAHVVYRTAVNIWPSPHQLPTGQRHSWHPRLKADSRGTNSCALKNPWRLHCEAISSVPTHPVKGPQHSSSRRLLDATFHSTARISFCKKSFRNNLDSSSNLAALTLQEKATVLVRESILSLYSVNFFWYFRAVICSSPCTAESWASSAFSRLLALIVCFLNSLSRQMSLHCSALLCAFRALTQQWLLSLCSL